MGELQIEVTVFSVNHLPKSDILSYFIPQKENHNWPISAKGFGISFKHIVVGRLQLLQPRFLPLFLPPSLPPTLPKAYPLSLTVTIVILFAAFLHALWNFLVRNSSNKALGMSGVILGHVPLGVAGIIYAGIPSYESWGFILASGFVHVMYQIFLLNAYRFGELTQVYPIARGSAPLIITLLSVLFLSVELSPGSMLGIFIISGTIIMHGVSQFRSQSGQPKSLYLALLAGFCIAGYSMIDGYGTRISGNVLSFYGASTVVNALLFIPYLLIVEKGVLRQLTRPEGLKIFFIGGIASYLAYVAALWAVLSTPIAVVSSMRETSVVFALLLGTLILNEKITTAKITMTFFILLGVVVLRLN